MNNMRYFGQTTWERPAKDILDREYSNENDKLAAMLTSLESNLKAYETYTVAEGEYMDAADKRGMLAMKRQMRTLIAKIKELLAE